MGWAYFPRYKRVLKELPEETADEDETGQVHRFWVFYDDVNVGHEWFGLMSEARQRTQCGGEQIQRLFYEPDGVCMVWRPRVIHIPAGIGGRVYPVERPESKKEILRKILWDNNGWIDEVSYYTLTN